jgi:hypothetical protein
MAYYGVAVLTLHSGIKFFSFLEIKETGLEVNADKTKYVVMSRDQNAGRTHNIKSDNRSFERVKEFQHLGTTLTNEKSVQE